MELTVEQRRYCLDNCTICKAKEEEFLRSCNSSYDAALDLLWFVEECAETCSRYKNIPNERDELYGKTET
jgi:hypothetical protein